MAIAEFSIDHPGTYTLVSGYPNGQSGPPVVLAVARGSPDTAVAYWIGILASGGLWLGALGTGVVALFLGIGAGGRARGVRRDAAPGPLDPAAIGRALDRVYTLSQLHLPPDLHAMVSRIRWSILELLPHTGRFPLGSRDVYVLQRTATEYLPTSLDAYLGLPTSYATAFVLPGGETALQALRDQLALLETRVREISDALRQRDSEQLLVHGRFLELAFARQSGDLGLQGTDRL